MRIGSQGALACTCCNNDRKFWRSLNFTRKSTVFRNKPIKFFEVSLRVRPEIGVPTTISSWPL